MENPLKMAGIAVRCAGYAILTPLQTAEIRDP